VGRRHKLGGVSGYLPLPNCISGSGENEYLIAHYRYLIETTFPLVGEIKRLWLDEVPRTALAHRFLLEQLLATASYHLASLESDARTRARYCVQASKYQTGALAKYREALSRVDELDDNLDALLPTSILIITGAFMIFTRSMGSESNPRAVVYSMCGLLSLFQGIHSVFSSIASRVARDSQMYLLHMALPASHRTVPSCTLDVHGPFDSTELHRRLDEFLLKIRSSAGESCTMAQNADDSRSHRKRPSAHHGRLIEAVHTLVNGLTTPVLAKGKLNYFLASFSFPARLHHTTLASMRDLEPASLTLLAYYCLVLHVAETRTWFMCGASEILGRALTNLLHQDDTWWQSASWPLEIIRNWDSEGCATVGRRSSVLSKSGREATT
jgi:hypothetical protein